MKVITKNKKARFEYEIIKTFEAGIVLNGNEIKSIRQNNVNLNDSFCKVNYANEVYIMNMHIKRYEKTHKITDIDEDRSRKLLLHKKEIKKISAELKQSGYALIPTMVYLEGNLCKVEIALARGKKMYDKRQTLKERDTKRQLQKITKTVRR